MGILKLITHLADRAPQWIGGHSGQGMGEADIATNAIQSSGQGAQKYGMYAGEKANSVMDSTMAGGSSIAKKKQDDQEKNDSANAAQARHNQMIEALSGGKSAGQGGGGEGKEGEGAPPVK